MAEPMARRAIPRLRNNKQVMVIQITAMHLTSLLRGQTLVAQSAVTPANTTAVRVIDAKAAPAAWNGLNPTPSSIYVL